MAQLREIQKQGLLSLPGIGQKALEVLEKSGYTSIRDIAEASAEELEKLPGFGKATVEKLVSAAKQSLQGE